MENSQDKVVAFDTLFTTNHIQMLKILLSYLEPSQQKNLAVYIKYLELQYTISFFKLHSSSALPKHSGENAFDASKLCDEIIPLCNPSEQDRINRMKNMYQSFANMQEMMQMMQMMKDLFPEGENTPGVNPSALFSGLSGMSEMSGIDMSQISQIFEMFQNQ